jgi:hypothetical protein
LEGNTREKASPRKQNREKKMKKRIRELENKRMELGIRVPRNNKCRLFSYSLILLFSAIGAANGAKLCEIDTKIHESATSTTWSIRNTTGTTISGVSACAEIFPINSGTTRYEPTDGSGGGCFCKMTAPKSGAWVLLWNFGSYNYCKTANNDYGETDSICSSECLRYIGELPLFRKIVLAS